MSDPDVLREAAEALRHDGASVVDLTVADWLMAEAAVIEAIPPLCKLIWGIDLEFTNGLSSVIAVGETEDGKEQLRASSTAHGLAVALAVLGRAPEPSPAEQQEIDRFGIFAEEEGQ